MSNYFADFPVVDYRFGDEETFTQFQHLGTTVDILEQVKQYQVYYETYEIQNGERPEQLSFKLYEDVNYYWTFYLLNDHLRQSGWPLRDADIFNKAQQYYPNTVIGTNAIVRELYPQYVQVTGETIFIPDPEGFYPLSKSEHFRPGNWIWFEYSQSFGKILKVDYQNGFIYTDAKNVRGVEDYMVSIDFEDIEKLKLNSSHKPEKQYALLEIKKVWDEYDAPHHYEDVDGNWIYPTPSSVYPYPIDQDKLRGWDTENRRWYTASSNSSVNSISYGQIIADLNQKQKTISVIKRDSIVQVVEEFNRLLRQ